MNDKRFKRKNLENKAERIIEDLQANLHDGEHQELLIDLATQGIIHTWDEKSMDDYLGIE